MSRHHHNKFTGTRTIRSVAVLALALAVGACSRQPEQQTAAPTAGAASSPGIPSFTIAQLSAQPTDNWFTSGGSLSNQRFSPLKEINKSNIGTVKAEWQTHLNSGLGAQHSGQGEPIVYEGVIYQVTGQNDVFAISVDTGEILWKYTAGLDPKGVIVCCGWTIRGLAVADGKVFVPRLDAHLMALDAKTGAVVWDTTVASPTEGYSLTGAPRYYEGKILQGVAGGEYQTRGSMQAFDAKTGKNLWTFYTIPGPGELGHDSWPADNDSWKYGGAPIWHTAAIDPELGLMYFSTGNASPDLNGSLRKGDNLFTISIVALDVNTGQYKWHFQEIHHDIWDYDATSPVVLFDVEKDGVMRKGLSQISKAGYLYILDRVTGQGLTPIVETPVPQEPDQFTAATQPIPQGDTMINHCIDKAPPGFTLVNNGCTFTPFGKKPVLYAPLSGSNWMPTAYDPRSGSLYLCASESVGGAVMQEWTKDNLGKQTGNMIFGGAFQLPAGLPRHNYQVAVDVRTHKIVWKQEQQFGCSTGATVTAGDLLLISRNNGKLMAYDVANGNELWSFQLDAPAAPSPVTFMHKGKQKILVYAGGALFAGGGKSDSMWLLSLDGTIGESPTVTQTVTPPSVLASPKEPDLPLPAGEVNLARGKEIYGLVCNSCHGVDGQGGHAEGGAMPKDSSVAHIFSVATRGGQKMPPFGAAFKPEELKSVAEYVRKEVLK